jgi:hypothetical protein
MEVDAEKLIVLVEQRPSIYDYTLKNQHNKDLIKQLWEDVANFLQSCKIISMSYAP